MSVKDAIGGKVISVALDKIAKSQHTTTVLGAVLAGVIAAQVDWSKVLQKDPQQIGNLVGACVVGLLGYYTNHEKVNN